MSVPGSLGPYRSVVLVGGGDEISEIRIFDILDFTPLWSCSIYILHIYSHSNNLQPILQSKAWQG
jgi:hypothetical protein